MTRQSTATSQPLLQPVHPEGAGPAEPHPHSPMTRTRARNTDLVPTGLMEDYDTQRASTGLLQPASAARRTNRPPTAPTQRAGSRTG